MSTALPDPQQTEPVPAPPIAEPLTALSRRDREHAREEEERLVGPLLARANLLRVRGQWDEAIAACTEALQHLPSSATAHSLIGEIYEEQDRPDDALQWYLMALELDPERPTDQVRLERLSARGSAAPISSPARAAKSGAIRPAAPNKAAATRSGSATERSLEWFDRRFPPGRAESIARLIWAVSGAITLLLLVAAGLLFFILRTPEANPGGQSGIAPSAALPQPPTSQPPESQPPVVMRPTTPSLPNSGDRDNRSPAPSSVALPTAAPAPTDFSHSAADAREVQNALVLALSRTLPGETILTDIQVNPPDATATLSVLLPAPPERFNNNPNSPGGGLLSPMDRSAIRRRVLRAALLTARTALAAAPRLQQIQVRASLRQTGMDAPPQFAFSGRASIATLRDAELAGETEAALQTGFVAMQWAPDLSPSP